MTTILGIKQNMSARFDQFGRRIPVTEILASPNVVLKVEKDKVQLGFGQKKKVKKTENAYIAKVGFAPRFIKEAKVKESQYSPGDKVAVSVFEPGDLVKVTGITRGRGFAGVVKRWGFAGGPKTHGQSDRHRAPGSIGQTTTPGRVFRGKKMAGHMGVSRLTITNLEVVEVEEAQGKLVVKGAVPGARNGLLVIQKTGKAKGWTPPPAPKEKEEKEAKQQENEDQKKAQGTKNDQPTENRETIKEEENGNQN
ncbi:50S ribosomal protein L3 [Candidatus Curtissbacteria bacterium]|nr:50S ribosomal protein L3 [Candidatus Curtissbacteria bacterium]